MRASLGDPFVDDRAVARNPLQPLEQRIRRGEQVIQKPELAKVGNLRDVKAKQIVLQRLRRQIEKLDLIAHRDGGMRIVELLPGQPRLFDDRVERNARALRPRIGEPTHPAVRARQPLGTAGGRRRFAWHWLRLPNTASLARTAKSLADNSKPSSGRRTT